MGQSETLNKKSIVLTGASGFIGKKLTKALIEAGYHVKGFSRSDRGSKSISGYSSVVWDTDSMNGWTQELENTYAVINLAGEPIASGRWSWTKRQRILQSRLKSITALGSAIQKASSPPTHFIQASAIGYYGTKPAMKTMENSHEGAGFLANVCSQVEGQTLKIPTEYTTRLRIGIVLDQQEGALSKMTAPMRFGFCGYPGTGRQYVSWIHIDDLVRAILHILETDQPQRVYNLTSPQPVTMKELLKLSARQRRISICTPIPAPLLGLVFGKQMAEETILASQHVLPGSLLSDGFRFVYPDCSAAIKDLFTV
jgi:uncharacterized protein